MIFLQNIWWWLVLLGVLILIHELGHYWAARFFDVKVDTFSIGFGPRLFGFRKGETDFRFSAILFGGYVRMAGEQPGDAVTNDPRSLLGKPRWQRLIISFAGPFMNIVLAVAVLTGIFMVEYPQVPDSTNPLVGRVLPNSSAARAGIHDGDRIVQIDDVKNPDWEDIAMKEAMSANRDLPVWVERNGETLRYVVQPEMDAKYGIGRAGWMGKEEIAVGAVAPGQGAARAGLQNGDLLLSVDDQPIYSAQRMIELISKSEGKPIELGYSRNGELRKATITPIKGPETDGQWRIGIQFRPRVTFVKLPFGQALTESVKQNARGATMIFQVLGSIVQQRMSAKTLDGPIGIAKLSGETARQGPASFFALMSMLSLNLALLNLLPIPILDGGAILMLLVEMIMRRDMSLRFKEAIFKVGFVFLMMVMIFVFYNDITKILTKG